MCNVRGAGLRGLKGLFNPGGLNQEVAFADTHLTADVEVRAGEGPVGDEVVLVYYAERVWYSRVVSVKIQEK